LRLGDFDQLFYLLTLYISYPVLLFVLNIEQYVFALFWLSLYLYGACGGQSPEEWHPTAFAGAAGSLLASGVFLFFAPGKGVKQTILTILRSGFAFLGFVIVFGQLPILTGGVQSIESLSHMASLSFTAPALQDKAMQYLSFVHDCLLAPAAGLSTGLANHIVSYQLVETAGVNVIGCVLLALAFLGFILNIKDKYCLACFTWMLFSYCLLGLAGWRLAENAMVMYGVLFSWALLSLIYKGLHKALPKHPVIRLGVAGAFFVLLAAVNIRALRELILFGLAYYPR
ncbi:MAG: hypothetical protein FWF83_06895, partial [Clostridiales bacterium]|nr:hypothetical protein [Clostridiales bacterium]